MIDPSHTRKPRANAPLAAAVAVLMVSAGLAAAPAAYAGEVNVVGTTSADDGSTLWQPLEDIEPGTDATQAVDATVVVDPSRSFQSYDGLGISIDETAVSNLWKLSEAERRRTVQKLVSPTDGAGMDRFRITIGSPDLIDHYPFWSYDELPEGVIEDFGLEHFSIQRDLDAHIIDVIKLIQEFNPDASFFASAWSAPAWMTTSNTFTGWVEPNPNGSGWVQASRLRDDAVDVFARYYVKFIEAYAEHGIHVDAITLLNEPGMDVVYPAMDITVAQQQKLALAIKREFAAAGLDTRLWAHDFNFWDWRDPNSTQTKNYHRIFDDAPDGSVTGEQVREAFDGVAFHPYWGEPTVMRDAAAETGLPVYMTETSNFEPGTVLDYMRLDAGAYIAWAQITDQDGGTLHWTDSRDNNVDWATVAATSKWKDRLVTAHLDTGEATFRNNLGGLGQFARNLDSDDVRVQSSSTSGGISNVVFRDESGNFTAVVRNSDASAKSVRVALAGSSFVAKVPAGSTSTFQWHADLPGGEGNQAPVLAAVDDIAMDQYTATTRQLSATDPDGDALLYYGENLPAGVSVDGTTGVVSIDAVVPGVYPLRFVVTDGAAATSVDTSLTVTAKPVPVGWRVEAEGYAAQNGWTEGGSQFVESTPGASGGKNVGWTDAGKWLAYDVDISAPGTYAVEFQVASGLAAGAPASIDLRASDSSSLATVDVPATGGWATYRTVTTTATLNAGIQRIVVFCNTGGFNLDYLRFVPLTSSSTTLALSDTRVRFGDPLSATVTVGAEGADVSGTVGILDGDAVVGTSDLAAGKATVDLSTLAAGDHRLSARFGGSGGVTGSTSEPVTVRVLKARTRLDISVSPQVSRGGAPITITVRATPGADGTVVLRDGHRVIGSPEIVEGKATLTVTLTRGLHLITATYKGSANREPAVDATVVLVLR